jgi:hypothetical protein
MKRQHPADKKKTAATAASDSKPLTLLNRRDSLEVMRSYYFERIQELEARLKGLTLLDNAREICAVCHEIIRTKRSMCRLNMKGRYLA